LETFSPGEKPVKDIMIILMIMALKNMAVMVRAGAARHK
jgi:hypothetical protein